MRRVFLPKKGTLSAEALQDLAYKLQQTGSNKEVNAVLIATATGVDDVSNEVPIAESGLSSLVQNIARVDLDYSKTDFFRGYDTDEQKSYANELNSIQNLARAIHSMSPTPAITVCNGNTADGGFALCLGRYNLATIKSSFQILHPLRGLTLEGGLSFALPRLAFRKSFNRKNDVPLDKVLALTGYQADCYDMVTTGLATHFTEADKLDVLERDLGNLYTFDERTMVDSVLDEIMMLYSSGNTYQDDDFANDFEWVAVGPDDSKEAPFQLGERKGSMLVDLAVAFKDVFNEDSVVGIVERLKEVKDSETENDDIKGYAAHFLEGVEARSPLAVHATFRLLNEGRSRQTLESCLQREEAVQLKLMEGSDFKAGGGDSPDWKHKSVADVSADEVEELFG